MNETSGAADVAQMSFEQAMTALEYVVRKLETGDVPLEASIGLYEEGARLKAHCEAKLRAAEERVAQITANADGDVTAVKPVKLD